MWQRDVASSYIASTGETGESTPPHFLLIWLLFMLLFTFSSVSIVLLLAMHLKWTLGNAYEYANRKRRPGVPGWAVTNPGFQQQLLNYELEKTGKQTSKWKKLQSGVSRSGRSFK
jgi:hypothetical protein